MEEDYELVPVGPIRRIERRMEQLEQSGGAEATKTLMEVIRSNQTIVDEMIKVNSDLVDRVSKLMESVSSLSEDLKDFMNRLEIANSEEGEETTKKGGENVEKIKEKMEKMEKRLNSLILTTMPGLKLKRG